MKVATWNVNSIKARAEHVHRWLARQTPDILCLQELKGLDFPHELFASLGYTALCVTQKAYNGVAILSKHALTPVMDRLPGDDTDDQARYLEVTCQDFRILNIYLPNGNPVESDKYPYKFAWMDRLYDRVRSLREGRVPFMVCGDFNVIPEAEDCYNPALWSEDALFRLETREKFRAIMALGLTDSFRVFDQTPQRYTFWDYQAGCWPKNQGMRIDHILTSPAVTDRLISGNIDTAPRGEDSPSDHTPYVIEIS
ncbi:MAG: exodeoxyribonuclease III [Alphaproteobacteria bacterium]|nr:exodeoxyribonuclease III [Alphaproteobacteria bacterium]